MNRIASPSSRSFRMTLKSCSTSLSSRLEVGSSRIRILDESSRTRAMATICWTAIEYEERVWVTSTEISRFFRSSSALRFCSFQSIRPSLIGSLPMKMFSATERLGQRLTSWYTVLIPSLLRGEGGVRPDGFPFQQHLPRILLVHAGENLDQRGFSGAVLSHDGVHFAAEKTEIHVGQALSRPEKSC